MEKSRIIEALGEEGLRLPALLNEGLVANDRAKYLFTLLQVAQDHADHPDGAVTELRAEREGAGLAGSDLDATPHAAVREGEGHYFMPGVGRLCAQLQGELTAMLAPVAASGSAAAGKFGERLQDLVREPWCGDDERITAGRIAAITSARREGPDSAHLLVMDLHKALIALQSSIAAETIDGAHVYGIAPGDRAFVAAFMQGVNRTRALKFDHPGLGTTATRAGGRLVIQNDIGTTDAHVLVVHVDEDRVSVTYTDVHLQRLLFFQSLFGDWPVSWDDTLSRTDRSMQDGIYHLCVGNFLAESPARLAEYLAFMGSRVVFLIDWNRARKRLRLLLPKGEVADLLKWAADKDLGHMAFLRAGGEQMVFDALAFVARTPTSFGARLDDVLGRGPAARYMRSVLRICSQGFADGRPEGLVRDEVRAELFHYFQSAQELSLDLAAEHAAFALEIASGIRDALLLAGGPEAGEAFAKNAERARTWEHRADEMVNRAREVARRSERAEFFRGLLASADDIADELEEAAFHLALVPADEGAAALHGALRPLAALAVEGVQEYVKAVETARTLHRGSPREDTQDFLEAIHRIMSIEERSDEALRAAESLVPTRTDDFASLFGFIECARNLESASDSLMHAGLELRDYVLGEMVVE